MKQFIKIIARCAVPSFVLNAFSYFLKNGDMVKQFELLAAKDKEPAARVDGYVKGFEAPETQLFFDIVMSLLMRELALQQNPSVLDVGCGTGRYLCAIKSELPEAKLFGVDASENTIRNYTSKLDGVVSACSDLLSGPNPMKGLSFDFIYSITVIEYIPFFKIGRFIDEIGGMVKHGGKVFLQFPQSNNSLALISDLTYTRYPSKFIVNTLQKRGFEVISEGFVDPADVRTQASFGYYILARRKRDEIGVLENV